MARGRLIPPGGTGWLGLWSQSDIGLTGAVLHAAPGPAAPGPPNAREAPAVEPLPSPFATGALNLTPSTLSASSTLTLPVFPAGC